MNTGVVKVLSLCIIGLFCWHIRLNGQTNKPGVVILDREPSVLYLGIDNYVTLNDKFFCNSMQWHVNNGTISSGDSDCVAILNPDSVGPCTISVNDKSGRAIISETLQVAKLPRPLVWLSGKSGGEISKKHLNVQHGIIAHFESPPVQNSYKIMRFVLLLIKDGKVDICYNDGAAFSAEAKAMLSKADTGSKLIIADVIALEFSNQEMKLLPAEFDITN